MTPPACHHQYLMMGYACLKCGESHTKSSPPPEHDIHNEACGCVPMPAPVTFSPPPEQMMRCGDCSCTPEHHDERAGGCWNSVGVCSLCNPSPPQEKVGFLGAYGTHIGNAPSPPPERRTAAPTVNTGGEAGQILDHLLCASRPDIRRQDAKDLLTLVAAKDAEIAALTEEMRGMKAGEDWLQGECQKHAVRADRAEADLGHVDEILARRPALADFKTRAEKIEHAIATAKRADKAEAEKVGLEIAVDAWKADLNLANADNARLREAIDGAVWHRPSCAILNTATHPCSCDAAALRGAEAEGRAPQAGRKP